MKNNNFTITTKKLAEICGVSQGTVDRALHERAGIPEKTRKTVLEKAKEYGYMEKKNVKPKSVGIVIFDLYNEYFSELVMQFEAECARQGYSLVVMFTNKDKEKEIDCIRQLYYMGVCGMILCPINNGEEFSRFLRSLKKPIVTVGNRLEGICHVGIDDFQAGYDAAAFLSQKSKHMIYYSPALASKDNHFAQRERYNRFQAYCAEHGIRLELASNMRDTERFMHLGHRAIACSSDCYLVEILHSYPQADVIGFDNLHSLSLFEREIPTVDCCTPQIAHLVMQNILRRNEESFLVQHKIVIHKKNSI